MPDDILLAHEAGRVLDYIRDRQFVKQPLEVARITVLTGWTPPQISRFLQEYLSPGTAPKRKRVE